MRGSDILGCLSVLAFFVGIVIFTWAINHRNLEIEHRLQALEAAQEQK